MIPAAHSNTQFPRNVSASPHHCRPPKVDAEILDEQQRKKKKNKKEGWKTNRRQLFIQCNSLILCPATVNKIDIYGTPICPFVPFAILAFIRLFVIPLYPDFCFFFFHYTP